MQKVVIFLFAIACALMVQTGDALKVPSGAELSRALEQVATKAENSVKSHSLYGSIKIPLITNFSPSPLGFGPLLLLK